MVIRAPKYIACLNTIMFLPSVMTSGCAIHHSGGCRNSAQTQQPKRTAMPTVRSLGAIRRTLFNSVKLPSSAQPSRALSITSRGESISREDLFKYTNGCFLANEAGACKSRYVRFDIDQLCAVAVAAGGSSSPIRAIDKMEGGFSKALIMRKEDGSEVVAKVPFSIAGPPKYTTASEVAVLKFSKTALPFQYIIGSKTDCIGNGSQ
jgi:hypothetical protein